MICDLCDKDQQNICERTFHFIKPINECLMRKAQENKQIIEELEKIKEEIGKEFVDLQDGSEEWRSYVNDAVLSCYEIVENRIHELKGGAE